jgi:uncharacterized membrane protein
VLLGILLILFGFVMIFLPKVLSKASEKMENYKFEEPSKSKAIITYIGGVLCIVVGILNIIFQK